MRRRNKVCGRRDRKRRNTCGTLMPCLHVSPPPPQPPASFFSSSPSCQGWTTLSEFPGLVSLDISAELFLKQSIGQKYSRSSWSAANNKRGEWQMGSTWLALSSCYSSSPALHQFSSMQSNATLVEDIFSLHWTLNCHGFYNRWLISPPLCWPFAFLIPECEQFCVHGVSCIATAASEWPWPAK